MTWTETKLKYLARIPITNGLGEAAQEGDVDWPRYIRTTDIASPRSLVPEKRVTLPPEVASAALVERDDLLLCAAGSLGKTYLHDSDEAACYAGYLVRFRADPAFADARFVSYWSQSQPFLDQIAVGAVRSTIDNYSAGKYQNMVLAVPPVNEQRRIADFLDDQIPRIDTAVHLRRKQEALMDEGLAGELDKLYDATRDDREAVPLGRLLARPPCYGVLVPRFVIEGVPFCRINALPDLENGTLPDVRIDAAQSREFARTELSPGDVLTSVVGTLGVSAVVPKEGAHANIARAVTRLQPAAGVDSWFIRGYLATPGYLAEAIRATGGGTAQATLNMGDIVRFRVGTPNALVTTHEVGQEVQRLFELRRRTSSALGNSVALLKERKRALITAAVTGQFDVTTARAVA